ncbi:MAG: hypothetical protein F6K28_46590 [Microcoleus sp. SIO2G3]|nr:hypothetical protein [Microcoleus sp. SIO2G3]
MESNRSPRRCGYLPAVNDPEILRVIAVGPPAVVNDYVIRQQQLGYAELHEWSRAVPTPNPGEVMRMLTKRVLLDS